MSVDTLVWEGPALNQAPTTLDLVRAELAERYAQPQPVKPAPTVNPDHDANDPYWRRFVRMGEGDDEPTDAMLAILVRVYGLDR